MRKDFTPSCESRIISIIKSVEPKNFFESVMDWFNDIALSVEDALRGLDIRKYANNIDSYHKRVLDKNNTTVKELKMLFDRVRNDDNYYGIKLMFNVSQTDIRRIYDYVNELRQTISPSNGDFNVQAINKRLSSFGNALDKNIQMNYKYIVYREDGLHFGSDQGKCEKIMINGTASQKQEIRDLIRKYHPNYSDKQIDEFVTKMNSNGCGYAAMANTVFKKYIGNEDEFEKKFGFPMYDSNGQLNSHLLLLDIYLFNGKHKGTDMYARENILESYMKIHGENVNVVNNLKVTTDNFSEMSKRGEIIISVSPITLRDEYGRLASRGNGKWSRVDAGHAMVITDVVSINGKKMFKVSTWGKSLYLDPNDYNKNDRYLFQQVRY